MDGKRTDFVNSLSLDLARAFYTRYVTWASGMLPLPASWDQLQPWQRQPFIDTAELAVATIRPRLDEVARIIRAAEHPNMAALAVLEAMAAPVITKL